MIILITAIQFAVVLLVGLLLLFLVIPTLRGAPYVPTYRKTIDRLIALSGPLSGKKVVDLGSGDGRIMIAYAKSGASVRGYEINPLLVIAARNNIRKAGLQFKAQAYWKSFWNQNLSDADIVTIFGVPHIMASLEKKLQTELKPGARIFSIAFPFPHWPLEYHEENIYYYKRL